VRGLRRPFETRTIRLIGEQQRATAMAILSGAPLDTSKPLEIIVREQVKARKPDQNALMWVGPLKDISEQAVIDGKRFSPEVWHEYFKKEFLPEFFDQNHCKEGYVKWAQTPDEERVLIGSTTQLTVAGFAYYMEHVYAFGGNLGVRFRANPNETRFAA